MLPSYQFTRNVTLAACLVFVLLLMGCAEPEADPADSMPEGAVLMPDGSYGFPPPEDEGYDRESYGDGDDVDSYGDDEYASDDSGSSDDTDDGYGEKRIGEPVSQQIWLSVFILKLTNISRSINVLLYIRYNRPETERKLICFWQHTILRQQMLTT